MTNVRGALPTLTEVIEVDSHGALGFEATEVAPLGSNVEFRETVLEPPAESADEASPASVLVDHLLTAALPRIDGLLEARLREVVAPTLLRQVEMAMRTLRADLSAELREVVRQTLKEERAGRGDA
jgi:hypothetical protein